MGGRGGAALVCSQGWRWGQQMGDAGTHEAGSDGDPDWALPHAPLPHPHTSHSPWCSALEAALSHERFHALYITVKQYTW